MNKTKEQIAEYIKIAGYVRYWEGTIDTAILCGDQYNKIIAVKNLTGLVKKYKEKVPEDLRSLVDIDLGKLEAFVSEI